ncbi:hypothetical protein SK128_014549 [Halocaridina rubra]|uniref:Peptidase M1 membrane alanine aminopeptidase domain-containing protein n=1 Tax=Halocaridina rubra TaxID=373956 RepID=A0AAN8X970_HALRR
MDLDRQFLSAHLETPVIENVKYRYSMYYTTELGHHPQGFFSFKYSDANGAERRSAATAFQPTYARRAFPCFDEPALKATFNISLARQTNMTAISNMPLRSTKRMTKWPVQYVMRGTILKSDFQCLQADTNKIWARKEVLHEAKYALDITSSVCKFFEEYFNISYPLPKLDVIALPSSNMMAFEAWGTIIGYS